MKLLPCAATLIDPEIIILSEVSQKDKYHGITYMQTIKNNTNESTYKTETESQTQKTNYSYKREKGGV